MSFALKETIIPPNVKINKNEPLLKTKTIKFNNITDDMPYSNFSPRREYKVGEDKNQ